MERWDRIGRAAAYGAAAALVPYLVIKVSWVVGSLLGLLPVGRGFSLGGWLVLNTLTIGMAAAGITLGLALVRPWGMRIPGPLVGFLAWVGSGFLVSILPFVVVSTLINSEAGSSAGSGNSGADAAIPAWEAALLQCSFAGTGIALAVALPAYLWRRWPHALRRPERTDPHGSSGPVWPVVTGAVTGLAWLYWAAGGSLGIAHRDERPAGWHVLVGVSACWALVASGAVLALVRRRSTRLPYPLLLASAWLGSGSMFAWSGWRLPATVYVALANPSDISYPENVAVAVTLHITAVLTGVGIMRTLLRGEPGRASVTDSTRQPAERVGRLP
ncbi:hypothetical protein OG689_37245 [Kitasatospora sp. NBC_00240]|uniref:hypothetical protein n=1 Tax=Kitasatospora sp. NBC_00240 TaxID=2903567 RepID=UPI0022545B24|nr:hypothetical protein [Kitasatospora sp. NBC_00240]MCX5214842.1 hypothetical protein [Kitasatospora sp. NBC_00240]